MALAQCCESYYASQSGSGIPVYNPQLGHGFFSNLLKGATTFLRTKVAPKLLRGASDLAGDVIAGKPFKKSAQKRTAQTLTNTFSTINPTQGIRVRRAKENKKRRRRNGNVQF